MSTTGTTQTALVTGASSGIGFELTRCLVRDGYRIIMVSKHEDRLSAAAKRIRAEWPNAVIDVIACDLAKPEGPGLIEQKVREMGVTINVLINDAGFGEHGFFTETNLQKELEIIQLNVVSLVHLTKIFLPEMVQRNSGRILQLGSIVSFMPSPLMAVYAATKAFVLSFTEALQNELKDTAVTMTVLCPPATDTNFFKVADAEHTKAANGNLATPEEVAQVGYEALMKGEARAIPSWSAKIQAASSGIVPDSVLAGNMHKQKEPEK